MCTRTAATSLQHRPPADAAELTRQLYAEHGAALRRFVFRLTGDWTQAEDVVQETLLRAWRHLRDAEDTPLHAWLYTVARNIVIDQTRTARHRREVACPEPPDPSWPGLADPDTVTAALNRILLTEALSRLPHLHREVLLRAYYLGWTTAQIADELGVAEGTAKSRIHYALRKLRLITEEMGLRCSAE